jgi:hypothetical protein
VDCCLREVVSCVHLDNGKTEAASLQFWARHGDGLGKKGNEFAVSLGRRIQRVRGLLRAGALEVRFFASAI